MAIIDNPIVGGGGGGGTVDETSALKYMLEHKTNYAGIAAGLTSLTALPAFTQPSGITVYSYMFDGCTSLATAPSLVFPSTGTTEFRAMFRGCTGLASFPSVSLDRANDASFLFSGCRNMSGSFESNIATNSCSAEQMFYNCSKLTTVNITKSNNPGFSGSLDSMFFGCTALTSASIPLVGSASARSMFYNCSKLTTVNFNLTAAPTLTYARMMFYNCSKLTTIVTGYRISLTGCTDMHAMFSGCSLLTSLPSITGTSTKSVTDFSEAFSGCSSLTSMTSFDMSSVTSEGLDDYVSGCTSLTNTALNNILKSLITATSYRGTKTLANIGLTSSQATTCTGLSNWSTLSAAGWTTGY